MRRSKFSESQIVEILREVEAGLPVTDVIRKHGISRATFFTWRTKYGGATVTELKRLSGGLPGVPARHHVRLLFIQPGKPTQNAYPVRIMGKRTPALQTPASAAPRAPDSQTPSPTPLPPQIRRCAPTRQHLPPAPGSGR